MYCFGSLLPGRPVLYCSGFYWFSSGSPECGAGILCRNFGFSKNVRCVAVCGCYPFSFWLALSLWGVVGLVVAGCVVGGCGGA